MAEKPAKKEPRIDRDTLVMWRENIQDAYAELDQTLATLIETFGGKARLSAKIYHKAGL